MKLKIVKTLIAFCVLISGAAICPAQAGKMVGGYRETPKTDETVIEAANFAVAAQSELQKEAALKLISIEHAERQIVAGSNYRLCLSVKSDDKPQQATATVYLNLQNNFSLTNWTIGKCAEDKAKQTTNSDDEATPETESVSYKGNLEVGKLESVIVYLGEESGDYAAFCFTNNSQVGRAVLAACKAGEQCEFVGKVNFESSCKVKNLEANLSASAKIMSVESVKAFPRKNSAVVKTSKTQVAPVAPDVIVKNLYAAQKANAGPFFQTKNRAVVDKYFSQDFADLIWKDAVTANGEVGAIEFDPLYHAQDAKITVFTIGKPEYDSNSGVAVVLVSFKNFGKPDTVKFLLEQDAAKTWKIMDIVYQNEDMLKGILHSDQTQPAGF